MAQDFRLVDKWINGVHDSNGIVSSWFSVMMFAVLTGTQHFRYCILNCERKGNTTPGFMVPV
jgi:hypothetical protein